MIGRFDGIEVLDDVIITPAATSSLAIRQAAGKKGTVLERTKYGLRVRLHQGHTSLLAQRIEVVRA